MVAERVQPDFERLYRAITRTGLPDRLPLAEGCIDVEVMAAFLGRPITGVADYVEFWKTAGYDYAVLYVMGQPLPDHFHQQRIGEKLHTDQGGGATSATFGGGAISDEQSFQKYPWVGPADVYYKDVDDIKDHLPDGMKLIVNQGPLFSGMWRVMGLESFSIACVEQPELIKAISEKIGELSVNIIENVVQREWVGAIWLGDDMAYTTSLMVSPEFLRKYVFGYYRRIGDLCAKYDKPFVFHSDGKLTEVFDDLLGCGVQAIHPNEPTSVDIVDMKKQWGDRVSFLGNVDVDLLARGSPADVVEATRHLIDNVAPGGGYALGSGNSVANYVPVANFKAMIDTVRKFGDIY